jgi:hypothetical protein
MAILTEMHGVLCFGCGLIMGSALGMVAMIVMGDDDEDPHV